MHDILREWIGETVSVGLPTGGMVQNAVVTKVMDEVVFLRAQDGGQFVVRIDQILLLVKPSKVAVAQPALMGPAGRLQ